MTEPRRVVPVTVSPAFVVELSAAVSESLLEKLLAFGVIDSIPEGLAELLKQQQST